MSSAYKAAGVDIAAAKTATQMMKSAVQATYTPQVLSHIGSFGGLFDAGAFKQMDAPVLVASTDGVGTKTMVAAAMNRWDTIGQDLVNHCINDIVVQGARPLFFLDYVASSKLDPTTIASIVQGMAVACQAAGVALLGGETAEMPGVYHTGEIDVVGTVVGVVDKANLIDGSAITVGDVVLALPATNLHTNGFTLARTVLSHFDWHAPRPDLGMSIGDALLGIHRCYVNEVARLQAGSVPIKGLAHVTGGGLWDNLPRVLPAGLGAEVVRGTWQEPAIFGLLQRQGDISDRDMFHAFNMGLGMLIVVSADTTNLAQSILGEEVRVVGTIIEGDGVTLR